MSDNRSTELHFSRAAPVYHGRAGLQRAVARTLLEYASAPIPAGRILELGCGTGFLTGGLLERHPHAQIDAIDLSAAMIEQARRTLNAGVRVRWLVNDARAHRAGAVYDLIASSSSLQWMQPLDSLFVHLATLIKPSGRLLCSLMVEGTLGELHRLRAEIAPHKPPRDRLPPVAMTLEGLRRAGFRVLGSRQETLHTEHDSTRGLFREIKELGFTGGPLAASSALLTRGELRRLAERDSAVCALPGGRVRASYAVLYFEAVPEQAAVAARG